MSREWYSVPEHQIPLTSAPDGQELFGHAEHGKEAGDLCEKIIKRGRALGVILLLATQRPDSKSLPTGISANVGIRFCLRVMGQWENDAILGTSMYRNGIRATRLSPRDKGIGYLVGASDDPMVCRTYYVDAQAADAIAARARALREKAGTLTGHAIGEETPAPSSFLDDLWTVLATDPWLWSETWVHRLGELRPALYGRWTVKRFGTEVRALGIETRQIAQNLDGERVDRYGLTLEDLGRAIETTEPAREIE